jgi:hypothetical protein
MKHTHYKVMASDCAPLSRIQEFLAAENARVTSFSKRFNFVAADDLNDDIKLRLREMGADVVDDFVFSRD